MYRVKLRTNWMNQMISVRAEICEKIQPFDEDTAVVILRDRIEEVLEHDLNKPVDGREAFLRGALRHPEKMGGLKEVLTNVLTWLCVEADIDPLPPLEG